ncbi:MAG: methyltransferase [Ruminococcaceae bacterium]|nr:methyltransferase [Oscillospiraceae bacterium]
MTSRELVKNTLEFKNTNDRVPRQLWVLPWARTNYPDSLSKIADKYPDDIVSAPCIYKEEPKTEGSPYKMGEYIDEWGCKFINIHPGIIGEVKEPIVKDDEWCDISQVHIPVEMLTLDKEKVNEFCKSTDCFVMSGFFPRPFEQLQFIRGTENLYMDLLDPPAEMLSFMEKMHAFYCEAVTFWAQTDVDAIMLMDDWGSQNNLLISPELWDKYFMPMYRDYINIAKKYGKKTFMHSDGCVKAIYPKLIELGLDALNSQIFCMGIDELARYSGKITFWGEIDRQHILSGDSIEDVENAVKNVYEKLWKNGGCIAQFEFGPGVKPENAEKVFETWENLR